MIVYKSSGNYIIKLRIDLEDDETKTNLNRTNVEECDKMFARYRTNKAFVMEIYDKDTKTQITEIYSEYTPSFKYTVGAYVYENTYDDDASKTTVAGIHFFLVEEIAFYWNKQIANGIFKKWYDNGKLERHFNYKNYKKTGLHQEWYDTGKKQFERNYDDDKLNGLCKDFYNDDNNNIKIECNYKNNKLHGQYMSFYNNNNIKTECTYKNEKLYGLHKTYYDNKQIYIECNYNNDKMDGNYKEWYPDGKQ